MSWKTIMESEGEREYFSSLKSFVERERKGHNVYPAKEEIFNAFKETPFNKVKIVLLGMDPYHNPGQAMGLSFSVPDGVRIPPSLQNIFKEMKNDLLLDTPKSGDLSYLARQGVLLLNSSLTVRENAPGSHMKYWQPFTDKIIQSLDKKDNLVYILWGAFARSKKIFITNESSLVIENVHPSPLSAYGGFFGSKPFSQANEFLISKNIEPIDWTGLQCPNAPK